MPVRKIPKNHLVVTGGYASRKNLQIDPFESHSRRTTSSCSILMRQSFLRASTRKGTCSWRATWLCTRCAGALSARARYGLEPKKLLVDVKHADDLAKRRQIRLKFECARKFSEEQGWEFRIVDQNQIRTPRLANLKFLRSYRNITPSGEDVERVLSCVDDTPQFHQQVLDQLALTDDEKLYWLPVIWSMLTGHLVTDMNTPFGSEVPIARAGDGA